MSGNELSKGKSKRRVFWMKVFTVDRSCPATAVTRRKLKEGWCSWSPGEQCMT